MVTISGRAIAVIDGLARRTWVALGTLLGFVIARAMLLLALGPGLILDDWTAVGNREFLGVLQIADESRLASRPVEWLTYTLVYGLGGDSPVALLAIVTLLNLIAITALWLLLRRYFSPLLSWAVCAAWIVVPNHNAMTAWAANTQSVVAFILLTFGILVLSRGAWLPAAACLSLAVLGYQLTILPAVAAAILVGTKFLPLAPGTPPPQRIIRTWQRVVIVGTIGAGVAWASIEPTYPLRISGPRPWVYVSAHFGEGLFAGAGVVTRIAVVFAVFACLAIGLAVFRFARGDRGRERGPTLVVVGLCVMACGSLGVVLSGSQAYGMTDRLYAITSVGSVIVWIGIAKTLAAYKTVFPWALALVWTAACLYGQFVSLSSWSRAGDDVVELMHFLDDQDADPESQLVVGPRAVRHNNIVGIVSPHAPDNALWLHRGSVRGTLRIAKTPDEFLVQEPGEILIRWPE